MATLATVVLLALGLTACHPSLFIGTSGLYPGFQRAVVDYVNRCDPSTPTDVEVHAPGGTKVSVDGQQARSGEFTAQVDQQVGERFVIQVSANGSTTTHHVRCLPVDFPQWSSQRNGTPQAQYYSTVLTQQFPQPAYAVIFDTNGVPVWWLKNKITGILWTRFANGNFATDLIPGPMQEYNLNGQLVRQVTTLFGESDFHDAILLPNGNYVLATAHPQACDLTAWGKPADSTCLNHLFEELTPQGALVWHWNTAEHIPVTETTARWRTDSLNAEDPHDPWHYNSVEFTGDGFIISFRHLDAIYKVNKATGNIVWKLGGTARPESLQVIGDPVFSGGGTFSGQHDARRLPDGRVTLYDNGTGVRAPRAVAYRVDEAAGTATFDRQLTDSQIGFSGCCGSTRSLPDGSWATGWGNANAITEHRPDRSRVFTLSHPGLVYRGLPILPGQISPSALRAGMDSQYTSTK